MIILFSFLELVITSSVYELFHKNISTSTSTQNDVVKINTKLRNNGNRSSESTELEDNASPKLQVEDEVDIDQQFVFTNIGDDCMKVSRKKILMIEHFNQQLTRAAIGGLTTKTNVMNKAPRGPHPNIRRNSISGETLSQADVIHGTTLDESRKIPVSFAQIVPVRQEVIIETTEKILERSLALLATHVAPILPAGEYANT